MAEIVGPGEAHVLNPAIQFGKIIGGIIGLSNEVPPVRPGEGLQDGGRIAYVTRQGTDRGCKGGFRRIIVDRKSVVEGKSVSVRVDLGSSRIIQKKNNINVRITKVLNKK